MKVHFPHPVDLGKSTFGGWRKKDASAYNAPVTNPQPYLAIGQRLKAVRKSFSDLSQKDWAARHNFPMTRWNNWEKGTRRIPVDEAERLCETYGLTLDFVYRGRRDGLSDSALKRL